MSKRKAMAPDVVNEFAAVLHARRSEIAPPLARSTKSSYDLWTILHEREVGQIDAALARIRAGRFGECVACGGQVETLHLFMEPASERCLTCTPRQANAKTA